jgi:ribulose-phosphate 3-epimerase
MRIIPAILTNDLKEFDDLMTKIITSKKFDRVQVDFIDGEYANNKTILPSQAGSILKMDAHLMVVENNLQKYLKNSDKFDRIIAQIESISNPEEFDCLALDIHSPVEVILPYLPKLKLVNLMAIEPGFGGQSADLRIFERISYLSNLRSLENLSFLIAVDGGVEQKHLKALEELGVDEVVVGAARMLEWK